MLGLGSSLTTSAVPSGPLLGTYTSDFTSDDNGWTAFGITNGTMTITPNSQPSGVQATGWLKCSLDSNEGIQFGIELATPWGADFKVGDQWEVTMKLYNEDNSPQDDPNTFFFFQTGSGFNATRRLSKSVTDGAVTTNATSSLVTITGGADSNLMRIGFATQSSAPGAGDAFYVRDIVVSHYRP